MSGHPRKRSHDEGRRRASKSSAAVSPRAVMAALGTTAMTPQGVAAATGTPVKPVRRALLDLYRDGRVERLLTTDGVLYAPKETR